MVKLVHVTPCTQTDVNTTGNDVDAEQMSQVLSLDADVDRAFVADA